MNNAETFEQWVMRIYGKSVYQIALEVAQQWRAAQLYGDAQAAWIVADGFVKEMRERYESGTGAGAKR